MIKIITGVMTSGKSERLIEEINKCEGDYLILKPSLDTRDGAFVKTRAHDRTYPAVLVDEGNEQLVELVINGLEYYDTVFLDETQFFGEEFIKELISWCDTYNINIIASGITRDFKGHLFPAMRTLWTKVEKPSDVTQLYGKCYKCDLDEATKDVLMDKDNNILTEGETVQIEGETENHYETLCLDCYDLMVLDEEGV
jgi:thymidine kinase